ncbi:unnamed protein product [Prorocentrum cordatum]|uniref:Uncharacterized protein n=1 Tax=Prorocentrum cordatum TaxID=2364126 RepID=A0ABN9VU54_9DINO|nr:unnamed protein product [Polarella glacialis]
MRLRMSWRLSSHGRSRGPRRRPSSWWSSSANSWSLSTCSTGASGLLARAHCVGPLSVLAYVPEGTATTLRTDAAMREEARLFLGRVGNMNFMRCSFVNLLRRLDEAKGRFKVIGSSCVDLASLLEKVSTVEVPRLQQHCEYRAGLMGEMGAICAAMQAPAPASVDDLIKSYAQDKDKSLLKMACDIASASAFAGGMNTSPFELYGDAPACGDENCILSSTDLTTLLNGMPAGIGMGREIVDVVIVGTYQQVSASWVDASAPAWRLLDAAPVSRDSDSSLRSLLAPLLGADWAQRSERFLDEGARDGIPVGSSLSELTVHRTCDVLGALLDTLGPLDAAAAIEWLPKLWSPPEAEAADDGGARLEMRRKAVEWSQVVTKATQLITLAAHLAQRYETNDQSVTTSSGDDAGTVTHKVDKYVVGAVISFNELAADIASDCKAGGDSFDGFSSKCAAFAQSWGEDFWDLIAARLSDRLHRVSQATRQLAPGWKSYITDTKHSKALAVKHLLTPSAKETLPAQADAQCDLQQPIAEAFANVNALPPSEHPCMSKTYKLGNSLLEEAQECVNIVAAVTILENTKPAPQPTAASLLLDTIGENLSAYPAALVKPLQLLKSKKM